MKRIACPKCHWFTYTVHHTVKCGYDIETDPEGLMK